MRHPKIVTWVVVANGARARILARNRKGEGMHEVLPFALIGRNLPTRAQASDRPGVTFDRRGYASHAMGPRLDAHRLDKLEFARSLAEELAKGVDSGACRRLVLIAPPQTLGDLRAVLPERVRARVQAEITKDLTALPARAIRRYAAEALTA